MTKTIKPKYKKGVPYGEVCPVCDGEIVSRCRCSIAHSKCASGHMWHYHGDNIVLEKGDNGDETGDKDNNN